MNKGTFSSGQPVFNQLLNLIPHQLVDTVAKDLKTDFYSKSFRTYDHLVTMLYAILNQCTSLREVTTGMMAWENRILHLGLDSHPRRSTFSDANKRRSSEVFEKIYFKLLDRYGRFLPDSQAARRKKDMYIFDSTTISLSQEILKGSGLSKSSGKRKGGIKVHTLLNARQDIPCLIRYSSGAENDRKFLKQIQLPMGSVIVFDRAYLDYTTYNRFTEQHITWVTRLHETSVYQIKEDKPVNQYQEKQGVRKDRLIELGHDHAKDAIKVPARLIDYTDPRTGKEFQFVSNNTVLAPLSIANYYRRRWQIETFFKRIKQNYPLKYFLGDNENAIKIQIWCALIADLLLKIIRKGTQTRMAFSNLVGLIRLHMMTYMNLGEFLRNPEKTLLRKARQRKQAYVTPSLFSP